MIRIVNTNSRKLNSNYNGQWRNSQESQRLMGSQIDRDTSCTTPQSSVDAIAAAMDNPEALEPKVEQPSEQLNNAPLASPREQDIANMMQNYIRQNGGIVQDEQTPKVKKDQTLFG